MYPANSVSLIVRVEDNWATKHQAKWGNASETVGEGSLVFVRSFGVLLLFVLGTNESATFPKHGC